MSLEQYASTDRQREIARHVEKNPDQSFGDIARLLGVSRGAVSQTVRRLRKRQERDCPDARQDARESLDQHILNPTEEDTESWKDAPAGYRLEKLTVQRDAEGKVVQTWQRQSPHAHALESVRDSFIRVCKRTRIPLAPAIPAAPPCEEDLLCFYPMGDPHLNMVAAAHYSGEDWDLDKGSAQLKAATDILVDRAPPAHRAVICPIGDTMHANGTGGTTHKGTPQAVDQLYDRALDVTIATMLHCIYRALEKHQIVEVIIVPGNHDTDAAVALCLAIKWHFKDRSAGERVIVRPAGLPIYWVEFGANLIGATHGHLIKPGMAQGVMIADQKGAVGRTDFRHVYFGHVHHKTLTKEQSGMTTESIQSLCAKDGWHFAQGYRAGRSMFVDVWHRTEGKDTRIQHNVKPFKVA